MKKVAVVHTTSISINDIKAEFHKQLPEVELINIIDDSIVSEIIIKREPSAFIIARLSTYFRICQELGCCCILSQCSSISEATDIASRLVDIPVFKIDYPMARKAAQMGNNIGIIATAISTLSPSKSLFEKAAKEIGKDVKVTVYYCKGAHKALFKENNEVLHNRIVINTINKAITENDVVALAQVSMAPIKSIINNSNIPVLTSIESGIAQIKDFINM